MIESLWAVIPAAGYGIRAGRQVPKQFVPVGGKTLLEWTAGKVLSFPEVNGVVIAVPAEFETDNRLRAVVASLSSDWAKPVIIVPGAGTRQDSVALALEKVPSDTTWAMVHDASRPLFSASLFNRVFEAARFVSAAICGISVADTVKSLLPLEDSGQLLVGNTLSREGVALIQTPQIFKLDLLRHAHEMARRDGFTGTDDSQLVERLGFKVAVVEGERTNFKITFPEDFRLASALLENGSAQLDNSAPEECNRRNISETGRQRRGLRRTRFSYRSGFPVIGLGFDVHPLVSGRKCILGGVEIPHNKGLSGHSDADVLCHAVADAILGALGMGDIGRWFPPEDPGLRGVRSLDLLRVIQSNVRYICQVIHLDCTLIAQAPRLAEFMYFMKENIAEVFSMDLDRVSIKATSPEGIGSLGRGEGIAAFCTATVLKKGRV